MKCFVFPLPQSNLFPQTTKPLNIFEPKYLKMIRDSIEQQIPIAIGYIPEFGDTYRTVAGFGYPQIIDERPNQTMLVFIAGQGKVSLKKQKKTMRKKRIF